MPRKSENKKKRAEAPPEKTEIKTKIKGRKALEKTGIKGEGENS